MSFWTTPSGLGFRVLDFLVRRLPPVRSLRMELHGAVDYHDYYVTTIDKALGQPRGDGDLRTCHAREIARLRGTAPCTCGNGHDPECEARHATAISAAPKTNQEK